MAKILLIDDDVDLVEMYRLLLTRRGHQVRGCHTAKEARKALSEGAAPDLVVLDVMMESTTAGFELAREIHRQFPALPILMPSGVHQAADVPFRFEPDEEWLPVVKFLDKPVAPEKLVEEIEAVLAGGTGPDPDVIGTAPKK